MFEVSLQIWGEKCESFKISLLFFILQISLSAQWYDIANVPHGRCDAIDAYDSLIATGAYTTDSLYLTTDGGNSWLGRPLPGKGPVDISIIGENKIWFCTDDGKIYHTIDGGYLTGNYNSMIHY